MMSEKVKIHKTSIVGKNSKIGVGTKIWHFSHIMDKTIIGKNCNIGQNVFIAENVKIGNNVKIQNNVSLFNGIICEDNVFIGPSAVFTNVINPRSQINRRKEFKKTTIKIGSTVGANSTIICGLRLGKYSFVGAGSVVTKNINDFEVVVGNPAKHIYWMSKAGLKLIFNKNNIAYCKISKEKYFLKNGKVKVIK